MIQQSFCYPIYRSSGEDVRDLFQFAKDLGYHATEWWGWSDDSDEVAETARSVGLQIASFTGHNSIDYGFADPSQWERIEAELRVSVGHAQRWGVPGIIGFPGSRDGKQSDTEALTNCIRGIRRVLPLLEESGVRLNIEILNSRVDHPGYYADTVGWGLALVEAVNHPLVKILFDIYHVQIMEGDVIRRIQQAGDAIGHIHTAGNPGRHELDDHQELFYPAIMRALANTGYQGYVGHEFFPVRLSKRESLAQAYHACALT